MKDVVDARLSLSLENELLTTDDCLYKLEIDCVVSLLELGLSCSHDMPSRRTTTGNIVKELHAIKISLLL